jgi:hypothetical protein
VALCLDTQLVVSTTDLMLSRMVTVYFWRQASQNGSPVALSQLNHGATVAKSPLRSLTPRKAKEKRKVV